MTLHQMTEVLVDKGHRRDWAEAQASADLFLLNTELSRPELERTRDCSVCRRTFTELEMRYHYHPCE